MKLRLRLIENPPHIWRPNDKREKPGNCRGCGRRLTDEKSKKRGYGPECFDRYVGIVFEYIPDTTEAAQ